MKVKKEKKLIALFANYRVMRNGKVYNSLPAVNFRRKGFLVCPYSKWQTIYNENIRLHPYSVQMQWLSKEIQNEDCASLIFFGAALEQASPLRFPRIFTEMTEYSGEATTFSCWIHADFLSPLVSVYCLGVVDTAAPHRMTRLKNDFVI